MFVLARLLTVCLILAGLAAPGAVFAAQKKNRDWHALTAHRYAGGGGSGTKMGLRRSRIRY